MRKGLWIVVLAVLATAAACATDLVSRPAKGNAYNDYPGDFNGNQFKKFWEGGTACPDYTKIDSDDDDWWTYGNPNGYLYAAQMFRLDEPSGYTTGTLKWQVRGDSGQNIYLYRYLNDGFVYVDNNAGGSAPPTRNVTVPASWFDGEGVLWIMAVVETSSGNRGIDCDVLKIQY